MNIFKKFRLWRMKRKDALTFAWVVTDHIREYEGEDKVAYDTDWAVISVASFEEDAIKDIHKEVNFYKDNPYYKFVSEEPDHFGGTYYSAIVYRYEEDLRGNLVSYRVEHLYHYERMIISRH